jgi:hypothetical protein
MKSENGIVDFTGDTVIGLNISPIVNPVLTSGSTLTYDGTSSQTEIADTSAGIFTSILPTAVGHSGYIFHLNKRNAGNTWTVATTSMQTINGSLTIPILAQDTTISVQSDGANWIVI